MKFKIINLTIFIFISSKVISQENSISIMGEIYSLNNEPISDVHIINLNNRLGTISSKNGTFEIFVKENDVLLFSSIQYRNKKIPITKEAFNAKQLRIELLPIVNELDEVYLHGLSGSLDIDFKKTPKDTIPKANFIYKLSDLDKKLPGDEFGYLPRVNAESFTNPVYLANGGQGSKFNKQLEKERALKIVLNKKKGFPIKLQKDLGKDYFINILKIPEDEIFKFIDYCEPRNIRDKYYNNKVFEVIEILKKESTSYNETK